MSLENKNYVATAADIESLTRAVVEAAQTGAEGRASYLRALIATTQVRLKAAPRRRQAAIPKLSAADTEVQLAALDAVHAHFYEHVKKAVRETLLAHGVRTAIDENRRTNFARSSMSVARRWVKAGNDITSLVAGRTSKAMLAVAPRKKASARILTNRFSRFSHKLKPVAIALFAADHNTGRVEWEKFKEEIDNIMRAKTTPGTRLARGERRQAQ